MKKQVKKLALSKETVRMLEDGANLEHVAGGWSRDIMRNTCDNLSACNASWCC
jgi:hypothetical protein